MPGLHRLLILPGVAATTVAILGGAPQASAAAPAPHACAYRNVTIPSTRVPFTPPHVNGDADFDGHGPEVNAETNLIVDVTTTPSGSWGTLDVRIKMDARENQGDWTRAKGASVTTIYKASKGWFIAFPLPVEDYDTIDYRDNDHSLDKYPGQNAGSFVDHYEFVGDTPGDEAGTETGVTVVTKKMTLRLSTCVGG